MMKKYASLALIAILSFLLGCAAFFFVVAPMAVQPAVEPEEILQQETIAMATEPTTAPETEPVETVPPTEPPPTVPIPENVDFRFYGYQHAYDVASTEPVPGNPGQHRLPSSNIHTGWR